jgi:hypothetical protein
MVDVDVRFNVGEDQPINAEFEVQPDVTFTADIEVETAIRNHDELFHRDYPDQHPISAITGLEDALLNADKTFVFEQGIASDTWEITHNLNKYPSVTVVDSAGNEVIAEVVYTDTNNCVVTMTAAFKGKAYLN